MMTMMISGGEHNRTFDFVAAAANILYEKDDLVFFVRMLSRVLRVF